MAIKASYDAVKAVTYTTREGYFDETQQYIILGKGIRVGVSNNIVVIVRLNSNPQYSEGQYLESINAPTMHSPFPLVLVEKIDQLLDGKLDQMGKAALKKDLLPLKRSTEHRFGVDKQTFTMHPMEDAYNPHISAVAASCAILRAQTNQPAHVVAYTHQFRNQTFYYIEASKVQIRIDSEAVSFVKMEMMEKPGIEVHFPMDLSNRIDYHLDVSQRGYRAPSPQELFREDLDKITHTYYKYSAAY